MKKTYWFAAAFGAFLCIAPTSCSNENEELDENPVSEKVAYDKNEVVSDEEVIFSTFDHAQKNGLKSSASFRFQDIKVLHGDSDNFPDAKFMDGAWYDKINVDLNNGAGGEWIYLYYKAYSSSTEQPLTNMAAIASTRSYSESDLRTCMKNYAGDWYPGRGENNYPVNLNAGSGGKYIYLELSKSNVYGQITDFFVVSTTNDYTNVMSKVVDGRTYYPVKCYSDITDLQGWSVLWKAMDFNLDTKKHKKNIYIYYTRQ